jgi:hypothetical protein
VSRVFPQRQSTRLSPACDNRGPRGGPDFVEAEENPMRAWSLAFMAAAVFLLSGCGYNSLQSQDEGVKAAWSEVVNQYQRRADLIPNLVNTVKGYWSA